jgi:hypothetical protein
MNAVVGRERCVVVMWKREEKKRREKKGNTFQI